MFRALISTLLLVLIGTTASATDPKSASGASALPVTQQLSPNQPSPGFDEDAEHQFLAMANQARADAGLPPLQADEGLTQAARAHAAAMVAQDQLSHQLPGEPSLTERLAATSPLHFDHAGENVAYAGSVVQAQNGLIHSPPHRENLLNPAYNVVGMGVAWNGFVLYVTQDFGHSLPSYSSLQAQDLVAETVERTRRDASMTALSRVNDGDAQAIACSMAQADSIHTPGPRDHAVLRYTTMQPEIVPAGAAKVIDDRRARAFSVGSCYARTTTYPSGVYWVTLILY